MGISARQDAALSAHESGTSIHEPFALSLSKGFDEPVMSPVEWPAMSESNGLP